MNCVYFVNVSKIKKKVVANVILGIIGDTTIYNK